MRTLNTQQLTIDELLVFADSRDPLAILVTAPTQYAAKRRFRDLAARAHIAVGPVQTTFAAGSESLRFERGTRITIGSRRQLGLVIVGLSLDAIVIDTDTTDEQLTTLSPSMATSRLGVFVRITDGGELWH